LKPGAVAVVAAVETPTPIWKALEVGAADILKKI
jgi:hypothetical protein